ncbi:SH3 domain-binding protein 2 isoform X2 [Nematostella vectensis]|uniref:SH3 domain-binding protein 2 isoform X2 n=1 Tax=Nematostella vectensis TaxID=45351 RepID=UPI0020779AB3|nr:SH3 domain-binding protein 2 isoform X2 [Nematostella vectensis]
MSNGPTWRTCSMPTSRHNECSVPGNRIRSRTDTNITAPKHPEPYMSIPAQSLVQDECHIHCGTVRKENKYNMWQDRYLVLHKGCMYYYKNYLDKSAKGQFSLSGYRVSTAPERDAKLPWVFKLTHLQPEKRTFYFAAKSEKELNEWMSKIKEDIDEYCEPLATRSGFNPECEATRQSSSGSSDDGDSFKYDYPLFAPEFPLAKALTLEKLSESQNSSSASSEPKYCPPPSFDTLPNGSPPPPPARNQSGKERAQPIGSVPTPVMMGKSGKSSVDISAVILGKAALKPVQDNSLPPLPKPRSKLRQSPRVHAGSHPSSPSPPTKPPKPSVHKYASDPELACLPQQTSLPPANPALVDSSDSEEDDYLKILPDEESTPNHGNNNDEFIPRLSTLERLRPEGKSFRTPPDEKEIHIDVLPATSVKLDIEKTKAIAMLEGRNGMYILHQSRSGDIGQCLSVCIEDRVRHFLVFYSKVEGGYALDRDAQRFPTLEEVIRHHYTTPLPKQQSATLEQPYRWPH